MVLPNTSGDSLLSMILERKASRGRSTYSRNINDDLQRQLADMKLRREQSAIGRRAASQLSIAQDARAEQQRMKILAEEQVAAVKKEEVEKEGEKKPGWGSRVFDLLDAPAHHVARPAMGALLSGVFRALPGQQAGEQELREAVGTNPFSILFPGRREEFRQALEKTKLPRGVYTAMELAMDPLNFVPLGVFGKAGKLRHIAPGIKASPKGVKAEKRFRKVMPIKERMGIDMPENKARWMGEKLAKTPIVGRLFIGPMNPSLLAKTDIGKAIIGWRQLMVDGESMARVGVTGLAMKQMPFVINDGFIKLKTGKVEWHTLFGNSGKYKKQLTKEQSDFIDEYTESVEELFELLPKELRREIGLEVGEKYIPRKVIGSREGIENLRISQGKSVGAKASSQKTRYYQTTEEAIENGVDYLNDPVSTLMVHAQGIYRTMADDELIKQLKPFGGTALDRVNIGLRQKSTHAFRIANAAADMAREINTHLIIKDHGRSITRKVPPRTIQRLIRHTPDWGNDLDRINKMPTNSKIEKEAKRVAFRDLKRKVDSELPSLKKASKKLKEEVSADLRNKRMPKPGEGFVDAPGFRGRIFDIDTANELNQAFGARAIGFLNTLNKGNDISRLATVGFDFGAGMIQGFALLASNPLGWVRSQKLAMQTLWNPQNHAAYINKHSANFQKMGRYGVEVSQAEQVAAGQAGGILANVPVLGVAARRAASVFNAFGDAARNEMWQALEPVALRSGKGDAALKELADFVTKATGVMSNTRLGIDAGQASVEAAVFFAPRYYRAAMGLMIDVFQGGLRGDQARVSLMKMMAAGTLFHYGTATALGQEPNLDPRDPKFLTVDIGGQNVGIGTIWTQMARFTGKIVKKVDDEEISKSIPFTDDFSLNTKDNPLTQFVRYRTSPVVSVSWDVVTGVDAIGRPVGSPLNQPLEFAPSLSRKLMPIWAQDVAEDLPFIGNPSEVSNPSNPFLTIPSEMSGLRVFPSSIYDRQSIRRDELAEEEYLKKWEDLEPAQKRHLLQGDALLTSLNAQVKTFNLERADDVGVNVNEYFQAQEDIRGKYNSRLIKAQEAYEAGKGDGKTFRSAVDEAGKFLGADYDLINSESGGYRVALQEIAARFDRNSNDPNQALHAVIADEYFKRITIGDDEPGGSMHDDFGMYNFRERDRRIADIRSKLLKNLNGNEASANAVWDQVMLRVKSGRDLPQMMEELRDGRDLFKTYWEASDDIANDFGALEIWEHWRDLGRSAAADDFWDANPILKRIKSQVSKVRISMRKQSPALDAWLIRFGYTDSLQNKTTLSLGRAYIERSYSLDLPIA